MHFFKNNIFIIAFLFCGCSSPSSSSSSSYKIITDKDLGADVIATADRFLPYCEKVIKDDGTVSYGFMILFLDEQKTVGGAAGMLTTEKACLKWESGAQKILDTGELITLRGFGNIEEPKTMDEFTYTFEKHGTYYSNGRSVDFFSIRNNNGRCFSVNPDRCL